MNEALEALKRLEQAVFGYIFMRDGPDGTWKIVLDELMVAMREARRVIESTRNV